MPFMRSESCSFIWQPNVVTWKRFTRRTVAARSAPERSATRPRADADRAPESRRVVAVDDAHVDPVLAAARDADPAGEAGEVLAPAAGEGPRGGDPPCPARRRSGP